MIIKDGSYKQIETRGRQTIAYNIFVKSKHSCRQMRKFNHIRSNRKCFIYKLILNILSYRENEILDFPLFPVKLVDGDLKYEVVQNFYSKISGTVNYANTSYVSNQKFYVKVFYMLLPLMNYSYNFVNK